MQKIINFRDLNSCTDDIDDDNNDTGVSGVNRGRCTGVPASMADARRRRTRSIKGVLINDSSFRVGNGVIDAGTLAAGLTTAATSAPVVRR